MTIRTNICVVQEARESLESLRFLADIGTCKQTCFRNSQNQEALVRSENFIKTSPTLCKRQQMAAQSAKSPNTRCFNSSLLFEICMIFAQLDFVASSTKKSSIESA